MKENLLSNYDSLCYAAFLNIKYLTEGADYIYLKNFDYNNKEHQFIIAIVNACYTILNKKEVIMDIRIFQKLALERKYKAIGKIKKPKEENTIYVDVPDLLNYMRGAAHNLFGQGFSFGDIYDEYYSERS